MTSDANSQRPAAATEPKLSCSFCGKSQDEVRKLIAGPTAFICDECVDLCNDVLAREVEPGPTSDKTATIRPIGRCPLCNLPKDVMELRMIADKGVLCVECIDLVVSAVESMGDDETT